MSKVFDIDTTNKTISLDATFTGGGVTALVNAIYPVGIIVTFANNTNPNTAFPGTKWERHGGGAVAISYTPNDVDFDTLGKTGGEKTHTLTEEELASHEGHMSANYENWGGTHAIFLSADKFQSYGSTGRGWSKQAGNEVIPTGHDKGGNKAHNNMPPYIVVARWKRVS